MSAHAHTGTLGNALRSAGVVTPRERLDATARRILAAEPPERRASALLTVLAADLPALWELMQPVAMARAEEFMRSLAVEVGEGEGRNACAKQAAIASPSPDQSPQGGDAGQGRCAEQATNEPPASQHSAQAEGREGQMAAAEQAKASPPSRPRVASLPKATVEATKYARVVATAPLLDRMLIFGTPLRNATAGDCRKWLRKQGRMHWFVSRLITGLEDHERVGDRRSDAQASDIWEKAMEQRNASI